MWRTAKQNTKLVTCLRLRLWWLSSFPLRVGVVYPSRLPLDITIRDKAAWSMVANDAATASGSAREISGIGEGESTVVGAGATSLVPSTSIAASGFSPPNFATGT